MLRVLLQKANDSNPTVAANVLMCLGELACVGGEDAMPHVPELMQVIIARLSDPSLVKRDAALHTLGQFALALDMLFYHLSTTLNSCSYLGGF
jgi:HEAT repeat.